MKKLIAALALAVSTTGCIVRVPPPTRVETRDAHDRRDDRRDDGRCPPGHRWHDGRCHEVGRGHDRR